MAHYSVKQQDHQKFICLGLTGLQQNEDLVDMTIAADGHYVKVHKILLSVASPYFKQIIADSDGYPVLYLNKVSFATLCSILEYIYIGESRIEYDKLDEFIQVCKDLQINGLMDLIPQSDLRKPYNSETNNYESKDETDQDNNDAGGDQEKSPLPTSTFSLNESEEQPHVEDTTLEEAEIETKVHDGNQEESKRDKNDTAVVPQDQDKTKAQFSISNQGTLQAIFNRFIYNQCYVYKGNKNLRQWRCFQSRIPCKCPASIVTDHEKIVKRLHAHNHSFHDKHIMKKMKKNCIFAAISEAETQVTKSKFGLNVPDSK